MAMAEYAWTSFNDNAKVFEYAPQGNKENKRILSLLNNPFYKKKIYTS